MSKTYLSFNLVHNTAQHPFDRALQCDVAKGFCTSDKSVYLYTPFTPHCFGAFNAVKRNTTITSHSFSDRRFFQAPEIDLAFSSLVQCPPQVQTCYEPRYKLVRCTTTRFVIASHDDGANSLNTGRSTTARNVSSNTDPHVLRVAQAISSLGLSLDLEIQTLEATVLRLQCRNTRVMLTNLRATQFINPSAALSVVLNRQAFATMGTTTLNELACLPVKGVLRPSLWVGRRLASRPIIEIEYQNHTRVAQLTMGGYVRWGLREFMPRNEGFLVFQIDGRNFVFKNGTLVERGLPVLTEVGLPSTQFSLPSVVPDPSHLADSLDDSQSLPVGLDYLHSALNALVELNHAQLTTLGIDGDQLSSFQDHPTSEQQQKSLLSAIADIVKPTTPLWLRALRYTAYAWGVITTLVMIATLVFISLNCCGGSKPTQQG